jgi:hypothetical protein
MKSHTTIGCFLVLLLPFVGRGENAAAAQNHVGVKKMLEDIGVD